jgi:fumarate reductase subunit D
MRIRTRFEPLFWLLFGAGAMAAAMILPALFLVIAFGFPLGWFGTPEQSFERMRILIDNPIGKGVMSLVISLVFWHSAHHLRHFAYDVGLHPLAGVVSATVYGLAGVGTITAFRVLGGI